MEDGCGTMIDALEVSLQMLDTYCGNRKYRKRLFLITDGERNTPKDSQRINELVE